MSEKSKHTGMDNLIPLCDRTKEEQRIITTMGGKASGEARRKKKTMREYAQKLLYAPLDDMDSVYCAENGIDHSVIENKGELLMLIASYKAAIQGKVKDLTELMIIAGEDIAAPKISGFDPNDQNTRRVVVVKAKQISEAVEEKD